MAQLRLDESSLLLDQNFCTGAHYIAGYAVEFAIKAVICKRLNVEIFDDELLDIPKEVSKSFKIHNLRNLIILSGLQQELKKLIKEDSEIAKAWTIVSEWNEQQRYKLDCEKATALRFLNAVKIVIRWIKTHW